MAILSLGFEKANSLPKVAIPFIWLSRLFFDPPDFRCSAAPIANSLRGQSGLIFP
jgi:hypothetical protein